MLAVTCWGGTAFAQAPPDPAPAPDAAGPVATGPAAGTFPVEGRVIDAQGRAIAGASVRTDDAGDAGDATTTDRKGHDRLDVPSGVRRPRRP